MLITCPHCGVKNISDYQSLCPKCGKVLSNFEDPTLVQGSHPENTEGNTARLRDEADKNRLRNERLIAAKRSLLPELRKELAEIDRTPIPDKPSFLYALFNKGSGARISIYLFFVFIALAGAAFFLSKLVCILILTASAAIGAFALVCALIDHAERLSEYYYITDDFDYYKEELKNEVRKKYNDKAEKMAENAQP